MKWFLNGHVWVKNKVGIYESHHQSIKEHVTSQEWKTRDYEVHQGIKDHTTSQGLRSFCSPPKELDKESKIEIAYWGISHVYLKGLIPQKTLNYAYCDTFTLNYFYNIRNLKFVPMRYIYCL